MRLLARVLAFTAPLAKRTSLAPARSGCTLRAEVTRESSGGGASLCWVSINHFKVKGSKVTTTPWRKENMLLSAAYGFPAAVRQPGILAALRRSHFPETASPAAVDRAGRW